MPAVVVPFEDALEEVARIHAAQATSVQAVWDVCPKVMQVADRVHTSHVEAGMETEGAHNFVHALTVAQYGHEVAMAEWGNPHTARKAAMGGLGHNADRLLQKTTNRERRDIPPDEVRKLALKWLKGILNASDIEQVLQAIVEHSGKNGKKDSKVKIALQDADRIANLSLDLVIRSGQHFHDKPPVDYMHFISNPAATYREPGSVLKDISYSLDWVNPKTDVCVRTKLGWELANQRAALLRFYVDAVEQQLLRDQATAFLRKKKGV